VLGGDTPPSRIATEGELARTLLALPGIGSARVGLRPRPDGGTMASIGLGGADGALVSIEAAHTARKLVALTAPGLAAGTIPVANGAGRMLLPAEVGGGASPVVMGNDRSSMLQASIERLLVGLVPKESLRVSVAVETEREASAREHRTLDRDSRVLRRAQTTEIAETKAREPTGEDAAAASGTTEGRDETRTAERFDYSETTSVRARVAGTVRRITVAVMIDIPRETAADGTVTEAPRSRRELRKIDALVKSAIGYSEERRDSVTIEQFSFADQPGSTDTPGMVAGLPSPVMAALDTLRLVQIGVAALVVLVLGLFVVRPVLMAGATARPGALGQQGTAPTARGLPSPDQAATAQMQAGGQPAALPGQMATPGGPDSRDRLREVVSGHVEESADVLKDWLDDGAVSGR